MRTDSSRALRIHSFTPRTRVAGPGLRCLIHTQGCNLACPGCFNPETHAPDGGELRSLDELMGAILTAVRRFGVEGITVSGGEPLQQAPALAELLAAVRAAGLSVVLYSGYTRAEIEAMPHGQRVLSATDVLIDGRYRADSPCHDGYRGSANQRLHFLSDRYGLDDFPPQPAAVEAAIAPDGTVSVRGFPDQRARAVIERLFRSQGSDT